MPSNRIHSRGSNFSDNLENRNISIASTTTLEFPTGPSVSIENGNKARERLIVAVGGDEAGAKVGVGTVSIGETPAGLGIGALDVSTPGEEVGCNIGDEVYSSTNNDGAEVVDEGCPPFPFLAATLL